MIEFTDRDKIGTVLKEITPGIRVLLEKASKGKGLSADEAKKILLEAKDDDWGAVLAAAEDLHRRLYGQKIHFFAPLYFSNYCVNNCAYCGFKRTHSITRKALESRELIEEAKCLWTAGHRTVVLIGGEHPVHSSPENMAAYKWVMDREGLKFDLILEVHPLEVSEYRFLRKVGYSRMLIFQETYDPVLYEKLHCGPKKNFMWRQEAPFRALEAGFEKVGLGILLGLGPYQEDLISLFRHAWGLYDCFGVFPATFSFPRLRSHTGQSVIENRYTVSEEEWIRIAALTRLAFPSTGIILSTRERPEFRDQLLAFNVGMTHMSAGSKTSPGGYSDDTAGAQFDLGDNRSLDEVVKKAGEKGWEAIY